MMQQGGRGRGWLNEREVRRYQGEYGVSAAPPPQRHRSLCDGLFSSSRNNYDGHASTIRGDNQVCYRNEGRSSFRLGYGPPVPIAVSRSPARFHCKECDMSFDARDDLDVHKLTVHHKEETDRPPSYGTFLYSKAAPDLQNMCMKDGRLGKFRGIQGENNSCYLDSSLMAMFYANDTFDDLLSSPEEPYAFPSPNTCVEYARMYLTLHIINNLRRRGFVPSMMVLEWRRMVSRWFGAGVDFDSHCPEEEACEFVRFLLTTFGENVATTKFVLAPRHQVDKTADSKRKSRTNNPKSAVAEAQPMLQLLPSRGENGREVTLWSISSLLESTLQSDQIVFTQLNNSLILQLPRYGKRHRVIGPVIPDTTLCVPSHNGEQHVRARFELRSLVVIGNSHFVTYLRVRHDANSHTRTVSNSDQSAVEVEAVANEPVSYSWLFCDSMSDRVNEENIPVIQDVTAELSVLEHLLDAPTLAGQAMHAPSTMGEHLRRVVHDASMAFYARVDDHVPGGEGQVTRMDIVK